MFLVLFQTQKGFPFVDSFNKIKQFPIPFIIHSNFFNLHGACILVLYYFTIFLYVLGFKGLMKKIRILYDQSPKKSFPLVGPANEGYFGYFGS